MLSRRQSNLVLLLTFTLFTAGAFAQEPKPAQAKPATATAPVSAKPAQRPPELKVLDRLSGVWLVEVSSSTMSDAADGKVDTQTGKGIETMQWALDNSFIAGHSAGESGRIISAWMWGYDGGTKMYRLWWFGAGGQMTEWAGAYDAASQTFTLRTQAGGYKSTATIQFIDDNSRKQVVEVFNPEGKKTQRIIGTMTRKK